MESLKNKVVLVTGAGGFIGSHIVEDLLKTEAKVVAFDIKPAELSSIPKHILTNPDLSYVQGNIADVGDVTLVFLNHRIDMVCHQAAEISVPMSIVRPDTYFDVNVRGTHILFDTARRCGVKKIVFASSCAVYDMKSPYAFSKSMCEELADMYNEIYHMRIIPLRYFNVYGPRQTFEMEGAVIPALIKAIRGGQPVIHGDGKQTRDFVFVRDVSAANIKALEFDGPIFPFEIGTGEKTSIIELYDYLCVALGGGPEPVFEKARGGDCKESYAKATCLSINALKWTPKFNMTKGLAITCFAYGKDSDE